MKTYNGYVVNHTYSEHSIAECFMMNELVLYVMVYMPDDTKGSHKQGQRTWMNVNGECFYPIDKRGKEYILDNVQFQQARKWVLRQSANNTEWEK